jgi:hypothetical protein
MSKIAEFDKLFSEQICTHETSPEAAQNQLKALQDFFNGLSVDEKGCIDGLAMCDFIYEMRQVISGPNEG